MSVSTSRPTARSSSPKPISASKVPLPLKADEEFVTEIWELKKFRSTRGLKTISESPRPRPSRLLLPATPPLEEPEIDPDRELSITVGITDTEGAEQDANRLSSTRAFFIDFSDS